jgi:hypothetical protein
MYPEYMVITPLVVTLAIALPLLFYAWKKERKHILLHLNKNEILQINATVMVGVLILLTLGTTLLKHLNTIVISLITASIIFPFAVSSIMVIISRVPENEKERQDNLVQVKRTVRIAYSDKDMKSMNLRLFPASIWL